MRVRRYTYCLGSAAREASDVVDMLFVVHHKVSSSESRSNIKYYQVNSLCLREHDDGRFLRN